MHSERIFSNSQYLQEWELVFLMPYAPVFGVFCNNSFRECSLYMITLGSFNSSILCRDARSSKYAFLFEIISVY